MWSAGIIWLEVDVFFVQTESRYAAAVGEFELHTVYATVQNSCMAELQPAHAKQDFMHRCAWHC